MAIELNDSFELMGRHEFQLITENQQLKENLVQVDKKNKAIWIGFLITASVVSAIIFLNWLHENKDSD